MLALLIPSTVFLEDDMQHRQPFVAGLFCLCLLPFAPPTLAEPQVETIGGDYYRGGSGSGDRLNAQRDVFASGASITVRGQAAGDTHVSGFDVDVELDTKNLYAVGGAVAIWSEIAEDLTAIGGSVKTADRSRTGGNARLMGGTVTVNGKVDGALMAMGGEVIIDSAVNGDVRITAGRIEFGKGAQIGGSLIYSSPEQIDIPASVIPADRVTYRPMALGRMFERGEMWKMREMPIFPAFLSIFVGFLITLAFILLIAAMLLSFSPKTVEERRKEALARPGLNLLIGVLGLSVLFGMVPVTGMTIVGIPFIPIIILATFLAWALGYVLGAYIIGMRLWTGLGGDEPALLGRLLVIAVTVTVIGLVNFIPFIGWLVNFAVVLLGIGSITTGGLERYLNHRAGMDARPAVAADYQ
jgi:hypothetical protein